MKIRPTHIYGSLALLLIAFLFYQNYTLKKNIAASADASQRNHNDKTGRHEDPYRAKAVKNTIIKNAGGFSACYKTYLTKNPPVTAGKVKMDWQILDSGRVKAPGVISSQLSDKDFHTCLTNVVSTIEFPAPPSQSYYVEHTFTFEKEKPATKK